MAVAEMERLVLSFKTDHLDEVLHLMQGFQGVHIETGAESTIPAGIKNQLDGDIREIEKNLQEIQASLAILRGRESAHMLGFLKKPGERKLTMAELKKIVGESDWEKLQGEVIQTDRRLQNNRARRHEVNVQLEALKIWEHLNCSPLDFKKLRRVTALFGSVHKKHIGEFSEKLQECEEEGVCFETLAESEDRVHLLLVYHNSVGEPMNGYMNEFSFSAEEYPFDRPQGEARASLEEEEARLVSEEAEIGDLIAAQAKYEEILAFAEDFKLNMLLRKKKSLEVTYEGGDIVIHGWIVADRREKFEKLLAGGIPAGDYELKVSPVRERDIDEVPIKLKNNRLVSIYEQLTEMYSLPKYNEIDPTPVLTVFYFIFFGLMVSDIGYGFAVFLLGFAMKKFLRVKRSTKSFVDFLFYLSFPIMGWGVVFGSLFGVRLPFALIDIPIDIIPLTVVAIILGYLHIMTGLVLHMANQMRQKKYFDMVTGGLSWFLTFLGVGALVVAGFVEPAAGGALFWAGLVLAATGVAMTVFVPAVQYKKRWYMGLGKGLYALYGAIGYFGDFVSYTRLMALGIAGGSVALAFNTILDYLPLPVRFSLGIVLALVLHGLNILLSMLSAYVHGIRLQFIEFFGKFYTGGGKKFEPFKPAEKNLVISDSAKETDI